MLSWESLHSICVGGVGVHVTELGAALERKGHEVHVFTRMGSGQPHYERIDGVHYHRCPFDLQPNFVDEINNMCRSFVHHILQSENYIGAFDLDQTRTSPPKRSHVSLHGIRPVRQPLLAGAVGTDSRSGAFRRVLGGSRHSRLAAPSRRDHVDV